LSKIKDFSFGSIVIDDETHHHDVVIYPDGRVKDRKGGVWIFGAHSFRKEELAELKEAGAEVIVIGTGTNARAHLSAEAESYAHQVGLELITLPSPEAGNRLNQLVDEGKQAASIIHTTC
jgi:hypothetical protein